MRLPSTLLVVTALTLLASGSALADANQDTKVSTMASPDFDVLDVNHNAGDEKRSLRGLKSVDEEDEERLAGANMFSVPKLEKAMEDPKYAKTLMMRWKRNGYDIEDAKIGMQKTTLLNDPTLNTAVYHRYAAWLDKHFSRLDGNPPSGGNNLFDKTKIEKAMEDSNAAKALFRKWKTHDYESDVVFIKLKKMGLKTGDATYDKLYRNYVSWLNVHYPDGLTKDLASKSDLFMESMLLNARTDTTYAESLFRAWKTNGYSKTRVEKKLKNTLGDVDGKLFAQYKTWLQTHFSKTTRS